MSTHGAVHETARAALLRFRLIRGCHLGRTNCALALSGADDVHGIESPLGRWRGERGHYGLSYTQSSHPLMPILRNILEDSC